MTLLSVFFTTLIFSNSSWGALRVCVDPGHGGEDKGAQHGGLVEAEINLEISQKLYQQLQKDSSFKVTLLRSQDQDLSLEERVQKAEQWGTDLFISVHANAHPKAIAKGAEFYIESQLPPDQESQLLAHNELQHSTKKPNEPSGDVESILFDLKKSNRILKSYQVSTYLRKNWKKKKKKMIRQGPFYVLNHNSVPSVLVEVGYLSNPQERALLRDSHYQWQLVKKIHLALKDYAKNIDKLPSSILQAGDVQTR